MFVGQPTSIGMISQLLFVFSYCKCFIGTIYLIEVVKMNMIAIIIFIFSHAEQRFS